MTPRTQRTQLTQRTPRTPRVPAGLVVVTDRRQAPAPLPEVVAAAVAGGARWVLLREKDLPRAERAALAARLREVLAPAGGRLVVAGPDPLGGDAVHLAAGDPVPAVGPVDLVGRSCHGVADLARLAAEDYLTLSPVYSSASKPGYGPPLGPERLRALCAQADRPVVALGGIGSARQAGECLAAGAVAVAMMGAVMRAPDPAGLCADVVRAAAGALGVVA